MNKNPGLATGLTYVALVLLLLSIGTLAIILGTIAAINYARTYQMDQFSWAGIWGIVAITCLAPLFSIIVEFVKALRA